MCATVFRAAALCSIVVLAGCQGVSFDELTKPITGAGVRKGGMSGTYPPSSEARNPPVSTNNTVDRIYVER